MLSPCLEKKKNNALGSVFLSSPLKTHALLQRNQSANYTLACKSILALPCHSIN